MCLPARFLLACVAIFASVDAQATQPAATMKIMLTDNAALPRARFPVVTTVRVPQDALEENDVRLFRVEGDQRVPVACQFIKASAPTSSDQAHADLVFAADVPAGGTVTYEVSTNKDAGIAAQHLQHLSIAGDGIGKTIDAGPVTFELHSASGQLLAFVPKKVSSDRLTFVSLKEERPIHWNPDVWSAPAPWSHTIDWNQAAQFDPLTHKPDEPPVGDANIHPFLYEEAQGPLAYRLTRWGKMPWVAQVDASVTYTFFANVPFFEVRSRLEIRETMTVNAVRNAELVFSRHQFDTAVWIDKVGDVRTAPCYDYADPDKSFKDVANLPPDVPCVGLANERKGYGIAYIPLSMKNVNKLTGEPSDKDAHFYVRDYDEHGKGHPDNFHYLVRPLVINGNYEPTQVKAGSTYEETSAILVFFLNNDDSANKYSELKRWQKLLASPLRIVVE
jgi:hypothetical protein